MPPPAPPAMYGPVEYLIETLSNMAGLSDNFQRLSPLFFVLKTVGDSVLKVTGLMSVVERFGSCHNEEEHNGSQWSFIAVKEGPPWDRV